MRYSIPFLPFVLAACGFLTAAAPPAAPAQPDSEVFAERIARVQDGVLALLSVRADGSYRAFCSAAWVERTHALTAAHCVNEGTEEEPVGVPAVLAGLREGYNPATNRWRTASKMDVVWADFGTDLAILRWAEPNLPPLHVSFPLLDREPLAGERVFAVGHPYGVGYFFSEGRVIAPRRTFVPRMTPIFTQHSAATYPGMSGGPVILEDGSLVCITSFGWDTHLASCVHRDLIAEIGDPQWPM